MVKIIRNVYDVLYYVLIMFIMSNDVIEFEQRFEELYSKTHNDKNEKLTILKRLSNI